MTNLSLVAGALTIALLCAEALVRFFELSPQVIHLGHGGPESAYELHPNPVLGYVLKKNYRSNSHDCHHTFPYTNAHGFRDEERSVAKQADSLRVIMLGDSVVAGHGMCDLSQLLSQQLEANFNQQSGHAAVEVLNFGIGGYCTRAEVELLKTAGLAFAPDLVLLVFVNNDYVNSNGAILASLHHERPLFVESLFSHSSLFRLIVLRFDLFEMSAAQSGPRQLLANRTAIGDDNVVSGLNLLEALSRQHDFKTGIILWPYFTDHDVLEPYPYPGPPLAFQDLPVVHHAQRLGFEVISLKEGFSRDFSERKRSWRTRRPTPRWVYTIGDGIHPSQTGAFVGAKILGEQLERLQLRR